MSDTGTVETTMLNLGRRARGAAAELATIAGEQRSAALLNAAAALRLRSSTVLAANSRDINAARVRGLSAAMLDRLLLNDERVEAMAAGLETVAALPDPLGRILSEWRQPNGLHFQQVSVPLGVIGIIYESRPNVTADAAALCIKSGNAVILRGGSESLESNRAIFDCLRIGMREADVNAEAIQLVPTTDRSAVGFLLSSMTDYVDVVVPRGGKNLIARVQQDARVPVIGHLEGLCHVYVHRSANPDMARDIVLNAKMRRTGICGAAETVLVDAAVADTIVPLLVDALTRAGCVVRGDETVCRLQPVAEVAGDADWSTEYLDAILSMRVVDGLPQALEHIRQYGSGHTESIIADDAAAANQFFEQLDSAILLHNASTQFADGGEFGMGAEIGIATGRIHARGPVGAAQLTSYKYLVRGNGAVRP